LCYVYRCHTCMHTHILTYTHTNIHTQTYIHKHEFENRDAQIMSGSIMGASRVFGVRPFSARWLRIEFRNNNSVRDV
jgi:hypothetical protein